MKRSTRGPFRTPVRHAWRLGLLSALLPVLAGCPGDGADRAARQGGMVIVAEGADMDKPLPILFESAFDSQLSAILYRPLLQPLWEDGRLLYLTAEENPMALARSYEFFGPDSASLRYRLRTDVLWSDGQPITAHDAAWTIRTQGNPVVASPRVDYSREIREVVVENDSTLVIHFTRRYPDMFFHTAGGVAPRHVFEDHEPSQLRSHPVMTNPVGNLVTSGSFRLAQWTRGQQVVLERAPDFEPAPLLDRIVFRVIPEETTRLIELQTGRVDITAVPFHHLDEIRRAGNIRIEAQEKRAYEYIAYNPRAHDFFADPEIRRALSMAVDVPGLISALQMDDLAVPGGGHYAPIFRDLYDPEEQAPVAFDPEGARRILAEKGWAPGRDGVLTRNGTPFRFTLMTNAENQRRVDISTIVQQQWRQIGVDARLQTLEFNTVIARTTARDFEARVGGWNVGLSPDLFTIWGDPDLPFNYVSYDNPEVQRLIAEAVAQPTAEQAAPIWRRAASIISAEQPYTWLFFMDSPYGVNDRVQGTRIDTLSPYQQVWEWWVEG